MNNNKSLNDASLYSSVKSALEDLVHNRPVTLHINWATILFFSFFIAYGYFGAITPEWKQFSSNLASSTLMLGLLTLVFIILGLLAWKASDKFSDTITITRNDIIVFLFSFVLLFIVSFESLQFSLFSDELSYSGTSHAQGMYIALTIANHTIALDNVPFKYLLQAISLVLLFSLTGLIIFTRNLDWKYKIIIFSLLLVAGRLVFSFTNGNNSPHPPLQLIPPFIFGSLLGISDFSFKLSYFTAHILFIYILFRMIRRVFSLATSYLLALAIGTIPVVWHLGTIVEQSFWGAVVFIVILVEIITSRKLNYARVLSVISIATLMRQPAFLAIIPVVLVYLLEETKNQNKIKSLSKLFYPMCATLIFIPFLGRSLVVGTPSTSALNEGSMIERAIEALNSGILWVAITNSVTYWWAMFIPFAFIPLTRKMLNMNLSFTLFFSAALFIYYSIVPSLWGYGKYQAEYAVPFAVTGMLLIMLKLSSFNYTKLIPGILAILLLSANTVYYLRISQINKPVDTLVSSISVDSKYADAGYHVLTAFPYNYKDAYAAIKQAGLTDNTYSIGATYGVLPEIMNGYSTRSVKIATDIYNKQMTNMLAAPENGWNPGLLEADNRIKAVLIGALPAPLKFRLIEQLNSRGWNVMGEYKNTDYGSTIVAMRR